MSAPAPIPFLDLVSLHAEIKDELMAVFSAALDSAGFIGGPMVQGFENDFAAFCGTEHCVGVGSGTGGGMMQQPMPGAPSAWLSYVQVDDIRAATAKARSLGAHVISDVTEVSDMGWMSVFTDPTGAVLAMWQPKPRS